MPLAVGAVAFVVALAIATGSWFSGPDVAEMTTSELVRLAKNGQITAITAGQDGLLVERTVSPSPARVRTGPKTDLYALLNSAGVPSERIDAITVRYAPPPSGTSWGAIIVVATLMLGIPLFLFRMMRQGQGPVNPATSFGRSRARRFVGTQTQVTFQDVAGVEEAKQELQEVVEFLKYPEKFTALGARTPRGVLLVGPPGTGKTLMAKAVAGEAGVPFFSISGSEFVEMFVGVGASRVRDLFDQAKKQAPCIVFVDEIDAVGRQRGVGLGGGNDEREQTLNQILVEMDGFDTGTNIIVIAATNRPDVLDPALLRPGRFDRQVMVDRPDINGRTAVLNVHARGKPLDKSVEIAVLAKQTAGFSGADLANLLNEAAILAARRDKKTIGLVELEEAVDRVMAGPARTSRVISAHDQKVIAYHEAGHAVVAYHLGNIDPLHKVTVVPRGTAGGYTRLLPVEDRYCHSRTELEETLAFNLGGRVAEEIVFAEISTGAANDIQQGTRLAREMVMTLGMSDRLGPVALGKRSGSLFLGRSFSDRALHSRKTTEAIDDEVRALVEAGQTRARDILERESVQLTRLAEALLEKETLSGDELEQVLREPDRGAVPTEGHLAYTWWQTFT